MVKIRDVAELAGVSPATVSRVINGSSSVAPKTRERVLQVIKQTEFVPNEAARVLYKGSSKLIGLIIPSIRNPYFTQLADEIDSLVSALGYRLFLCNVDYNMDKEREALQKLISMQADGVIIAASNEDIQTHMDTCSLPIVALDFDASGKQPNAHIFCDYYQGARMAVEHLLNCGCQNLVCVKGPQQVFSARERYRGYHDLCQEFGIPEQTLECDYDFESGLAAGEELLRTYPQVDGIFACNDIVAISIYKVLHRKHILVPEQVQLVGFDDIYLSDLISPELTTISQPIRAMAEKAVDLLLHYDKDLLANSKFIFPPTLILRETTAYKREYEKGSE